jgi:hypothetical protein
MRCLKNTVLKTITWLNGLSAIFCACCIDSPDWIYFKVLCFNLLWLYLFFWVNEDYYERKYKNG